MLDIIEELNISDFPVAVRINKNTPHRLLKRISEVIKLGGGVIAVYNEDLVIKSLTRFGYPLKEARKFANDGCWEVQIPGKTYFIYHPFDALRILLDSTLCLDGTPKTYKSMEELYQAFYKNLQSVVEAIYAAEVNSRLEFKNQQWVWKKNAPCTVVSLFTQGCIEKGLSYSEGGPVYNTISPHLGGIADVANSLHAIERLVFSEKLVSFGELVDILKRNWEGEEILRQIALNKYEYYGNDNDKVDAYAVRILKDFADMVDALNGRCPIKFTAGVSTFGRQIEWSAYRAAVPFGRKRGEILSGNASPSPGTDCKGATGIIKSYCKIDHARLACGSALDIMLHPTAVSGENGTATVTSLIKGFVSLGGFFMQMDIMDADVLKQAQENPEQYRTLSVRVSGWNARFVTLDKYWQQMVIERSGK